MQQIFSRNEIQLVILCTSYISVVPQLQDKEWKNIWIVWKSCIWQETMFGLTKDISIEGSHGCVIGPSLKNLVAVESVYLLEDIMPYQFYDLQNTKSIWNFRDEWIGISPCDFHPIQDFRRIYQRSLTEPDQLSFDDISITVSDVICTS